MSQRIVEVQQLTKKFGSGTSGLAAVDAISFTIHTGEIIGLLGPNGAGKTTTIHLLLGLITPTSGTIHIFGKDLKTKREEILQNVNFSSTYTHLPWRLSVWENLYVAALLYAVENPKQRVREVIEDMQLVEVEKKEVGELSSGWVTRVNLARTFINKPKFILLDEPTASLDPEAANEVRKRILKERQERNTTIIWTSHNMSEVEEVCDRVIFLSKGKILAEDTPEGLAKRIKTCRVSFMIEEQKERFTALVHHYKWNIEPSGRFIKIELPEDKIPFLLSLLAQEEIRYNEINIEKPTLEDFFLSISKK